METLSKTLRHCASALPRWGRSLRAGVLLLGIAGNALAGAHDVHSGSAGHGGAGEAAKPSLDQVWAKMLAPRESLVAAATFDARGRLWLARVNGRHLEVVHSDDRGRTFSVPRRVNAEPASIAAHGDARPRIVIARDGGLLVAWTENLASPPFASHVRISRSEDGEHFAPATTLNDDRRALSHAFPELGVDADGTVWAAWFDRRDHAEAAERGESYAGTALYVAASADHGRSFAMHRKLIDHVCECCRLALAVPPAGAPVALWRHVFASGVRDHAVVRLDSLAPPRRATEDDWQIHACPHHGPAMAIDAQGRIHIAWFTGAGKGGVFYRRLASVPGDVDGAPLAVGDSARQPGRPQLAAVGESLVLAWQEFDGAQLRVLSMASTDGGVSWSSPHQLAATAGKADHPQLLTEGRRIWLSWNTAGEGYRLIAVPGAES